MYLYIVLLHVVGAFVFALSHGVSVAVAFAIRGAGRERVAALLELSQMAVGGLYVGLVLLLVGGVWAGFAGGHWGRGWIWAALAILVAILVAMYAIATPYYATLRVASEATGIVPAQRERAGDVGPDDLPRLTASARPFALAAIGGIGLLVILWLMVVKPF
jgi:hypothetical protein